MKVKDCKYVSLMNIGSTFQGLTGVTVVLAVMYSFYVGNSHPPVYIPLHFKIVAIAFFTYMVSGFVVGTGYLRFINRYKNVDIKEPIDQQEVTD